MVLPYNPGVVASDIYLFTVLNESVVGQNFEHHE